MRAGALDRRVVLERYVEYQDDTGQPVKTYEAVDDVWAEFVPGGGREFFQSQQLLQGQLAATFRLRYRPDVDETMQIVHDGDVWGIQAVQEIGRREGLTVLATRKPSPGGNEES